MIAKYITTKAIAAVLVTFAATYLQFATRSQVLSGSIVEENLTFEFTVGAGEDESYIITPEVAGSLTKDITFAA